MAEEKLSLILEWIERNPEKYATVQKKLEKLNTQYEAMKKTLIDYNKPFEQQAKQYEVAKEVIADYYTKMMRSDPAFRMLTDAQKAQQKQLMEGVTKWAIAGKHIDGFGRKVGFTGFIVTFSIQRMIRTVAQFIKYFTDAIKVTADWPDKLMDAAYALALLEYQGLATADTHKLLSDTMNKLVTQGPRVEALWLGLQAVWTSIQVSLATALIPALTAVLNELSAFIVTREAQVALANLANAIGGLFIALAKIAPIIIQAVTFFAQLLTTMGPFLPILIPLVGALMLLGMVCSVLGPIFTVLGATIKILVKIKTWWLKMTQLNAVAMHQLKMSIITTISTLVILGVILWGLSRAAEASATDISKSWDKLSTSATKMEWKITDATGNLLYSIDTLTGDVSDSTGTIVGHYDSMSGTIISTNGTLMGSIDDVTGKFYGMDGSVGDVDKSTGDLAGAVGGLAGSMSGLDESVSGLNNSMNSLYTVMGLLAGVQILGVLSQLAQLVGLGAGVVGLTTALGGLTTALGGVLALPLVVAVTAPEQLIPKGMIENLQKGWEVQMKRPWWSWIPFAWDIAKAVGAVEEVPGGQFGIPRVPRTGPYWLERGEKVSSTRMYGPTEEEPVTTIVTTTPQMISITNYFDIGTLSTELDAEKLGDIVNRRIAEGIRRKRS